MNDSHEWVIAEMFPYFGRPANKVDVCVHCSIFRIIFWESYGYEYIRPGVPYCSISHLTCSEERVKAVLDE